MIIGNYSSKLTQGRRLAIPSKFRTKLGKSLIVARWYENCLVLVSQDNWEALLTKLSGKSEYLTSPVRDTDRFILGSAFEVQPDAQGRILLPEDLTRHANLDEEVVFIGLGNRVEIWNKDDWAKRQDYISKNASELVEKVANDRA